MVFFAVGFETTAPANAMAVWQAAQEKLDNFSILTSHVLVPPAMEAILSAPDNRVQGFLAAGHVCTVMGYWEYEPLAERHRIPIVVTGFEPLDLLHGAYLTSKALEEGRCGVENQYSRAVDREGNLPAQKLLKQVFEVCDRKWRGIGEIPDSGYRLRDELAAFDAELRFDVGELVRPGVARLHRRRDPARPEEAPRVRRLRRPLHAGAARSGRRWSPPRAPAPPTTSTAGTRWLLIRRRLAHPA